MIMNMCVLHLISGLWFVRDAVLSSLGGEGTGEEL